MSDPKPEATLPGTITLRLATPEDEAFQKKLYFAMKIIEWQAEHWDPIHRKMLLENQFLAQQRHYRMHYADYLTYIIELDGEPIGRTMLERQEGALQLVGISLLPPYRNQGIGTKVLTEHIEEARAAGHPVRLTVRTNNRAFRLYKRLGLKVVGENEVLYTMEITF